MKQRFSYTIVFLVGMVFGIALCVSLAIYNIHEERGKTLIGQRAFGDITILPIKDAAGKTLNLAKNNTCFMIIMQDSNGITTNISTVSKANRQSAQATPKEYNFGGFALRPLNNSNDWVSCYGIDLTEDKRMGEFYTDLNFDGQFDIKHIFDGKDKINKWIFINNDWRKVTKVNYKYAKSNLAVFCFDPNSGWLQNSKLIK